MKKLIAITVAILMLAATAVPALATNYTSIDGDSIIDRPLLNVRVPLSLDFAFDPFKYTGDDDQISQIVEVPFEIINRTFADVAVVFFLDAVYDDEEVTLLTLEDAGDEDEFEPADWSKTDKILTLGVIGADDITGTDTLFAHGAFQEDTEIEFDEDEALFEFDEDEDDNIVVDFGFVLEAATPPVDTDPAELAEDNKGLAAFMFHSTMNSYASWSDGDVAVSAVLWMTPLHPDTMEELEDLEGFNSIDVTDVPERPDDLEDRIVASEYDLVMTRPGNYTIRIGYAEAAARMTPGINFRGYNIRILLTDEPAAVLSIVNAANGVAWPAAVYEYSPADVPDPDPGGDDSDPSVVRTAGELRLLGLPGMPANATAPDSVLVVMTAEGAYMITFAYTDRP
jgi:hypothetical protein